MDSGQGGCNDNLVYGNDFSHAPTNGIEATFSRNAFVNNRLEECWHGIWGGYSFENQVLGNLFANNEVGIAIEHGQANTIRGNRFLGNQQAIELWQGAEQDPNWGYPRHRDTRSRDYTIRDNLVERADVAIELRNTSGVTIEGNSFLLADRVLRRQGRTSGLRLRAQLPARHRASAGRTHTGPEQQRLQQPLNPARSRTGIHLSRRKRCRTH